MRIHILVKNIGTITNLVIQAQNQLENFPESGREIIEKSFCFVHLDVDLYKSTIDALRFFFPKMVQGGVILIHDFHSDGIQKAFEEFKNENKIHLIELTGSQAMIIKN